MDVLQAANRLSKVSVTQVLISILNQQKTKNYITGLNTNVQLVDYGEDSNGTQLSAIGGIYAASTIRLSKTRKKNRSHINLKDTGAFHKTFDVQVKANANFAITANTMKGGQDLQDRWGDDIVGLQDENIVLVMEYLEAEFYKKVFKGL